MNVVLFVVLVVVLFNVGVLVGAALSYIGAANNSYEVWEVTNRDGHTYWLTDVAEVEAALHVDGMLAVRRLRVLA